MSLLEKIKYPKDLRGLKRGDLTVLAKEIRERILSVISESGGHLASSLGVVELTIALHYVYNTPDDKLVWDVGHQAYPHKILTGRNEEFPTIRQHGGLTGFPTVEESEYDCLSVGHASTSISAALGMAKARDLKNEKHHVVSVIGDGSMTGGLAYEGLNNTGAQKTKLVVILNDNSMSISKNVGAISHYLTRVISDPLYNKVKKDLWALTGRMSGVGMGIRNIVSRIDEGVKHFVIPGKLFEDLGFRYFGPVDGHNIPELIDVLKRVRNHVAGPALIHVLTKKGKGFEHAEKDATKFHGISKFEKDSGEVQKKRNLPPAYTKVFSDTLLELAEKDKKIVGVTAAMPDGTGLKAFGEKYPNRFFDVGIAEGHAVTFAAGLAASGLRPVVAIYSTFMQRAFDQLIHDTALTRQPVIFCLDRAGLVGDDGPTHHGAFDISYLRLIPNVVIMAPKDEGELRHMLKTAVDYKEGPVFIRYPRGAGIGADLSEALKVLPLGIPEVLQEGKDVLFLAAGDMVRTGEEAAALLRDKGFTPGLINARFIKPLKTDALAQLLENYSCIVTLEHNCLEGGFGGLISEFVQESGKRQRVLSFGYPDRFVSHGNRDILLKEIGLDSESIARKTQEWMQAALS